ncbi:UpxY family transcription antiterminator [Chitinophaga polysaccharea]|uniref:UpxY family transcription antiterminator n=1 Tax=Chitinophaga TaxID=79328 RepID=UPI0014551A8A|nr:MULTISPECIES: UpxY family transcription antiterminator [Chitinophaga]NLR57659.1 UpxY family transcription antiterminator [Chitinophaga polysaccharea]NLU93251.1 UpxY family transcription antiterminator [Chitinophaga sp. Ak27]
MSNFVAGWYLIYTLARQEKKVLQQLTECEVECFFPTSKSVRQWHDRKKMMDTPLFPSYVFVNLKSLKEFYYGQHVAGAAYYVRFGKQLARVDQQIINRIALVAQHGEDLCVSDERFQEGQVLLINKGPLCGLSCEVVKYKGLKRILVRVELLQRSILIAFQPEYLSLQNNYSIG